MTKPALLHVGEGDHTGKVALLVAAVCGHPADEVVRTEPILEIKTQAGDVLKGLGTISTYLASNSSAAGLLGTSPEEKAQVQEWLTWASTELAPLRDAKLAKVADWLQSRTYLVGHSLTLADVVVFGTVYPAVANLPTAQVDQFACLLRWFDHIQHVADTSRVLPAVSIQKPRFVPPPPPVASTTAPAKAAGKDATPAAGKGGKGAETVTADGKAAAKGAKQPAEAASSSSSTATAAAGTTAGAASAADGAAAATSKASKKEKKAKGDATTAAGAAEAGATAGASKKGGGGGGKEADEPRIDMLDIRVGTIVAVDKHPNADGLYLEEIDLGEDKPRQVISGLVKFVPKEKMQGRRVVVVCNLKPAKMRDVMSYGMVLCASNDAHDQVDPIIPPEGVPNGERISFEGFGQEPLTEVNPKKKILERLFPDLTTDASGTPMYKGTPFMTSKGPVSATIPNAHVA